MGVSSIYAAVARFDVAVKTNQPSELMAIFEEALHYRCFTESERALCEELKRKISTCVAYKTEEIISIAQLIFKEALHNHYPEMPLAVLSEIADMAFLLLAGLSAPEKQSLIEVIVALPKSERQAICHASLAFIDETMVIGERLVIIEVVHQKIEKVSSEDVYEARAWFHIKAKTFGDPLNLKAVFDLIDKKFMWALVKGLSYSHGHHFLSFLRHSPLLMDREFVFHIALILSGHLEVDPILAALSINTEEEKFRLAEAIILERCYSTRHIIIMVVDEARRITLASQLIAKRPSEFFSLKPYAISDEKARVSLAYQLASLAPKQLAHVIDTFDIENKADLLALTNIIYHNALNAFIDKSHKFTFLDPEIVYRYAVDCVDKHPSYFCCNFNKFSFLDKDKKMDILEKALLVNPDNLEELLKDCNLTEVDLILILKRVAYKIPFRVAKRFHIFKIKNIEAREDLIRIIQSCDLIAFVLYFPLFKVENATLIQVYYETAKSMPLEVIKRYHLDVQEGVVDEGHEKISDKEIVVAGGVLSDGLGDFFNIVAVAMAIQDRYRSQKVRLIIGIAHDHYYKHAFILQCPSSLSYEVELWGSGEGFYLPKTRPCFLPMTVEKIDKAAYTVMVSPVIGGHMPLKANLNLKEPGVERGLLGLKESDFGLLIPKINTDLLTLDKMQNVWVKGKLRAEPRGHTGMLYFNFEGEAGWLCQALGIYGAIKAAPLDQPIILVCNKLADEIKDRFLVQWQKQGITEVITEREGQEKQIYILSDKGPKRSLQLLEPSSLAPNDMLILQAVSSTAFVGCTGDSSFMNLIAIKKKIPLYQVRPHKRDLFLQYCDAAKQVLGEEHSYVRYLTFFSGIQRLGPFEHIDYSKPHYIVELMSHPDCLEGATRLHEYIKTEKNAFLTIPTKIAAEVK